MPRRTFGVSIHPFNKQLESRRQKRRAEFMESIGVRFDDDPASPNLPHIYLPRLHRQKTEKEQHTLLGKALDKMAVDNGIFEQPPNPHKQLSALQREIREFTDWILPQLKKIETDLGFKRPVILENFPAWRPEEKVIPCLLPFSVKKSRIKQLEPGYVVIQLPARDPADTDEFSALRADDRLHLSPRKTYLLYIRILRKAFHKASIPFERLRMCVRDDHHCIYYDLRNYGWSLEIIPAIYVNKGSAVFVSKPYHMDENAASDMRWRICWSQREDDIIRSISCTDKGLRVKALNIVCKLCARDWRLRSLTPYQVQTALLYDMDHHIDSSPRWQRSGLEACVVSLLNRLLQFARREYLPHFIIEGYNMFELVPPRTLILYKSALERLTNNEKALISLVERTRPETEEDTQWLETKYERINRPYEQIPQIIGIV